MAVVIFLIKLPVTMVVFATDELIRIPLVVALCVPVDEELLVMFAMVLFVILYTEFALPEFAKIPVTRCA